MQPDAPKSEIDTNEATANIKWLPTSSLLDFINRADSKFKIGTSSEEKRENMRGKVTSRIITMYVLCTVVIIGAGVWKVLFGTVDSINYSIAGLKTLVEFLNILVLPIITLVLGFYFGSEKR